MKNSPGFSLLEVLVASAIAVILSTLITMLLTQMGKLQPVIERYTAPYFNAVLVHQQMMRDITGAEVPVSQWIAIAQNKGEEEESEQVEESAQTKNTEKKAAVQPQKKRKIKRKSRCLKRYLLAQPKMAGLIPLLSFLLILCSLIGALKRVNMCRG